MQDLLPTARARDLKIEEFNLIPLMEVTFKYSEQAKYNYEASFCLVGKAKERIIYIPDITEAEMILLFPDRTLTNIRNAGELTVRLPLRIMFGRTQKNTLGLYCRYEFIINEKRNVIQGMFPDAIMRFIAENYKAMKDYIIWRDGTQAVEILNTLERKE